MRTRSLNSARNNRSRNFSRKWPGGGRLVCFGLTEPNKGSDAKGIELTAQLNSDGTKYVLNGVKRFITGANGADYIVLATRTGEKADRGSGITTFLVDMKLPGITVADPYDKPGQPGSPLCEVYFDNVEIPVDTMLGKLNQGWEVIESTLQHSRSWIAAQGVGIAQRAYDEAYEYAHLDREAFGKPRLIDIPEHAQALEVMRVQIEISRALTRMAAIAEDIGYDDFAVLSSLAKLVACDTASWAATESMQLHGGIGYTSEMPISRVWQDSPVLRIYEGTAPIQVKIAQRGGISLDTIDNLSPPKLSAFYTTDPDQLVRPDAVKTALDEFESHRRSKDPFLDKLIWTVIYKLSSGRKTVEIDEEFARVNEEWNKQPGAEGKYGGLGRNPLVIIDDKGGRVLPRYKMQETPFYPSSEDTKTG